MIIWVDIEGEDWLTRSRGQGMPDSMGQRCLYLPDTQTGQRALGVSGYWGA